jgi:hypothetical protein
MAGNSKSLRATCIGALWAFFGMVTQVAALAPDDPGLVALLAARSAAEVEVGEGNHGGAIDVVLQSLRDADATRPELADGAYGNGQLISYVLLHVMPEPAAYAYLENGFQPNVYETDKLVKALCTIAIGLEEADKTAQTREVIYLTSSENHLVRAMAMFFLSNPYFYDNTDFTEQYAELLAADYPDLELTQTALNLGLYAKRLSGDLPELAEGMAAKSVGNLPYQPWSASLRARIAESAKNLSEKSAASRAEAVAPLLDGVNGAQDWRERHFALLLMKNEFDGPLALELREVTRQLAGRKANTPDVLQARALLAQTLGADCAEAPEDKVMRDEAVAAGEALLDTGVGELTPERVMWETWAYGVRDCAKSLAAAGHSEEAIALYTALSEKLPGSKIAKACNQARAELFHHKPLLLQDTE